MPCSPVPSSAKPRMVGLPASMPRSDTCQFTLWVPIGIHWAWNYTQGNVFGLAVSGNGAGDTIFATTVNGPDIITGGAFGPEASIIAVVLGTLYTIVFLRNRYHRFSDNNNK